jgi:hypothetical protein
MRTFYVRFLQTCRRAHFDARSSQISVSMQQHDLSSRFMCSHIQSNLFHGQEIKTANIFLATFSTSFALRTDIINIFLSFHPPLSFLLHILGHIIQRLPVLENMGLAPPTTHRSAFSFVKCQIIGAMNSVYGQILCNDCVNGGGRQLTIQQRWACFFLDLVSF